MRTPAQHIRAALLAWALVLPCVPAVAQPLSGLDAYDESAMREWEVPGLALAIVKDDSVVYARGFGTTRLGGGAPVDANTLFANASTTKAFTTVALAMLVDEGKLRWDDPVTRHPPAFRLHNAHTTAELTVRDLVTPRSGLAAQDELVARCGGYTGRLEHWHRDTFRAAWQDPALGRALLTFTRDAAARPRTLPFEDVGEFRRRTEGVR